MRGRTDEVLPGGMDAGRLVDEPRQAARRAAAVALLVALTVLAATVAGPWRPSVTGAQPGASRSPAPPAVVEPPPSPEPQASPPAAPDPGGVPVWVWQVLILVAVAVAAYLLLRRVRWRLVRHPVPPLLPDTGPAAAVTPEDHRPDLATLREGVQDATEELRGRVDPADAVIAAWVALEEAAERSGVPRDPASTPTEFTVAVVDRTPAEPAAVRALLAVYLRARFGGEPVTGEDVTVARSALARLSSGLTPPEDDVAAPPGPT